MGSRWVTLTAGLFAMLVAGPIFTFGAIHTDVQRLLGASELEVQLIGVAGDIGLWLKVFPGLVFDAFGAKSTMIVGAFITCLGYSAMYLALTSPWSPALAAVAWFLAGSGSSFIYTSALWANMKNFTPSERGVVAGFVACMFGSSAAVLSALLGGCLGGRVAEGGGCVGGALGGSVPSYMLLLATAVPLVALAAAAATRVHGGAPLPARGDHTRLRFAALFVGLVVLIILVFGSKLSQTFLDPSVKTWGNYVVLAFLPVFLAVPIGAGREPPPTAEPANAGGAEAARKEGGEDDVGDEETPVLRRGLFWSLFLAFGITVGAALMTLNIISSMVISRGLRSDWASLLVVVQMGADTAARLLAGTAVWAGIARLTHLLVCAPILALVAQLMLARGGDFSLCVACALLGLSDGIMWMGAPLFVGQAFGLTRAGFNFGLITLAAAVFQSLFSLGLEPYFYRLHLAPGDADCLGAECFAATHLAVAACCAVAAAAALHLHCAWRGTAQRQARKTKTQAADADADTSTSTTSGSSEAGC